MDRYAGGMVHKRLKNMITRLASRKLRPKLRDPTIPVMTLYARANLSN